MKFSIEKIVSVAIFAALIIIGGVLNNGAPVIPITLANFFALLAGLYLGGTGGGLAVLIYILVGSFGLPVFARGAAGFGVLLSPTGGFILGYMIMAIFTGFLRSKKLPFTGRSLGQNILASIAGMLILYLVGTPYMAFMSDYYAKDFLRASMDMLPLFLLKDLPLAIAAGILFHFTYPQLKDAMEGEGET